MTADTTQAPEGVALTCPFDGEPAVLREAMGEHWVACEHCDATSRMVGSSAIAITAWNRRALSSLPAVFDLFSMKAAFLWGFAKGSGAGLSAGEDEWSIYAKALASTPAIREARSEPKPNPSEGVEAMREKVADAVLDACRQYSDTARTYSGQRKTVHTAYILKDATDAILSALSKKGLSDGGE